ncbi:MAG: DUF502 domain-containing protein [Syntrophales bacterium]|jgi:uncharacterized membrane protein|nr:DUF502 domain-containing protein [Syntrophales bacterium]MDD5532493.1 DUF502 domain-containing protein [Syntrophales bacterium]HPL62893.1 DUF502 domain-containing protein [Syntrophales bacterium]
MRKQLKKIFLTGLAVVVPVGVTIYVLIFLIGLMDNILAIIPSGIHPDRLLSFHIPGLGFIFTMILIFMAGLVTQSYLGGKVVSWGQDVFNRIPVIRNIYQPTKQIVDSLFSGKGRNFRRVVLVEFPSKGLYTIGFVTGLARGEVQEKTSEDCINVFVPTTPNPTSGYYLMIPEKSVVDLDMSVEEAFRLIISIGLVEPSEALKRKPPET